MVLRYKNMRNKYPTHISQNGRSTKRRPPLFLTIIIVIHGISPGFPRVLSRALNNLSFHGVLLDIRM